MNPRLQAMVQQALHELFANDAHMRLDALDTGYIQTELESIETEVLETIYPAFRARELIPVDTSDDPGAESVAYYTWDHRGIAKLITDFAGDLPMADAFRKKFTAPVHSYGIGYKYSVQDLRNAVMARRMGRPGPALDQERAEGARRGAEAKLDDVAFFGDTEADTKGFANNANVTLVAEVTGAWATATAAQIAADLDALVNAVVDATKGEIVPDTIAMPLSRFNIIATKTVDTTNQNSILKEWLGRNPFIKDIFWSPKLETAGASSAKRMIAYARDPRVLKLKIPQDYETFPPQAQGLAFVVPAHLRTAGVVWRYPVAAAYMDDI